MSRDRLSWPPLRSDLAYAICIVVLTRCLATGTWPGLAALALLGVLFCALVPRLKRQFLFRAGGFEIAGELTERDR